MNVARFVGPLLIALVWAAPAAAQVATAPPSAAIGVGSFFRKSQPLAVSGQTHPAIARIRVPERDGIAFGSGSLVGITGDQGLVVTNWHVVRDHDPSQPIEVTFPDGFRSNAKVLKTDRDWDLAALVIWKPTAAPIPLANTAPQPGDLLTITGYGGKGVFRAATARCTQYVSPSHGLPMEMVEMGCEARQGDSGGPILNDRGEIAGVLFGAGGGTTSGSYVGRVRTFVASVTPQHVDLPNPTNTGEAIAASQNNPFTNTNGLPRLQPPPNIVPTERPSNATPVSIETKPPTVLPEEPLRPIETPQSPDAPPRFARTDGKVTFGALPEQTAAPLNDADLAARDDQLLPLWSRPLPAQPEVNARTKAAPISTSPQVASAQPAWQSLLGETFPDQAKSVLAFVGLFALALRLMRPSAPRE